jgi:hypothetical protein
MCTWFTEVCSHINDRPIQDLNEHELYTQNSSLFFPKSQSNIVIRWKLFNYNRDLIFDFQSLSSKETTYSFPSVEVHLPEEILPQVQIFEDYDTGNIHVMFLTVTGSFNRIIFDGSTYLYQNDITSKEHWKEYQIMNLKDVPVIFHCIDIDTFVVATESGDLIVVDCPRPSKNNEIYENIYYEHEISQQNVIAKNLKTLFRPFSLRNDENEKSSPQQIVDIASTYYKLKMIAFTICRDKYLRIFSLYDYTCLKSISLNDLICNNVTDKSILNEEPACYISVFDIKPGTNGQAFKLAVFLPETKDYSALFLIFKGKLNVNGDLQYIRHIATRECDFDDIEDFTMIDFHLAKNENGEWVLWLLLKNEKNETKMKYITVFHKDSREHNEIEYNQWNTVITKNTDEFDYGIDNNLGLSSIQEKFIDYIFFPNRFSLSVLINSLNKYIKITQNLSNTALNQNLLNNINIENLKKIIIETIGNNVVVDKRFQQTDFFSAYQNCIKKEYECFLKICMEEYNIQNEPQSLAFNPYSSTIFIVKSTNISTLRPCSTIEIIHQAYLNNINPSNLLLLPPESFQEQHPLLANIKFRNDLQKYFIVLDYITNAFTLDRWQEISTELEYELSQHLSTGINTLAYEFYNYNLKPELEKHNNTIIKLFKRIQYPEELIEGILSQFEDLNINFQDENYSDENCFLDVLMDINNMIPSKNQYIIGLIGSGIQQVIDSYYEICYYLLIALIYIYNQMPNYYVPNRLELLKKCQSYFYILSIFKYFINCPANNYNIAQEEIENEKKETSPKKATKRESTHKQLHLDHQLLHKSNKNRIYTDSKSALPLTQEPQAFIHYLINHYCDIDIDFSMQSGAIVIEQTIFECIKQFITCDSSRILIEDDNSLYSKKLKMLQTYVNHFPLSFIYLVNDLELHGVFINILPRLVSYLPTLPSTLYLRGKILLHMDENDKAHDLFLKASTGFANNFIVDESLLNIMKLSRLDVTNLEQYYKHIINIFEVKKLHQQIVNFTKYAIELYMDKRILTIEEKAEVDYFRKLKFLHNLELRNFDEAYSSLVYFSDPKMRVYLLRQFVASLVNAGEILKLCSYSYTGMEDEFENTLHFKIRNSSIKKLIYSKAYGDQSSFVTKYSPEPDYCKILFSYYTFKGNFRDAAHVMYNYYRLLSGILSKIKPDEKLKFTILKEQSQSLLTVINSLNLINEKSRYIMIKHSDEDNEYTTNAKKRRKIQVADDEKSRQGVDIIHFSDIKKEYLFSLAKLDYVDYDIEDIEVAVSKYLEDKKYDAAVTLAESWSISSSHLFEKLASECIINLENYGNVFNAEALNEQSRAWKQLEEYLKMYENSENYSQYLKVTMETLFLLDQQIELPKWFIEQYKKKYTEDAVRIYLKYNRIEEATNLLIYQCQKYIESCLPSKTRIWISYALLDQVKFALKEKIKDIKFEKLKFEKFKLGYNKYDSDVDSDSEENSDTKYNSNSELNNNSNSNSDSDSESDSEYSPSEKTNSETETGSETELEDLSETESGSGSTQESESESDVNSQSKSEEYMKEEKEEEEDNDDDDESEKAYINKSEFSEEETKVVNNNESENESSILFSDMPSSSVVVDDQSGEKQKENEIIYKNLSEEMKGLEKLYSSLKQKIDVVLKL